MTSQDERPAKRSTYGLVGLSFLLGLMLAWVAVGFAAGGHGIYSPAIALFPYAMGIASLLGRIGIPALLVAAVQLPIYALIVAAAPNRSARKWIAIAHCVVAAIVALVAKSGGSFFP